MSVKAISVMQRMTGRGDEGELQFNVSIPVIIVENERFCKD
jgi:hypothetical protein